MDEDNSGLHEELELLEAIYLEDITVDRSASGDIQCVKVLVSPATGDNEELKYVCLTLEFNIDPDYPSVVPDIVIRNPRGLADDHISELRQKLKELAQERTGSPMLYELIELCKESLTESNVPHGQCVICLDYFVLGEPFTKTECYHHFHCSCLLRYIEHCKEIHEKEKEEIRQHKHMTLKEKEIVCPVCREPIEYDSEYLKSQASKSSSGEENIVLSKEIRELQKKMADLFERQKAKGGIIDVEAERNKYLIPSESQGEVPRTASPTNLFRRDARPSHFDGHRNHWTGGRGKPHVPKLQSNQEKNPHKDHRKDHRAPAASSRHREPRVNQGKDSRSKLDYRNQGGLSQSNSRKHNKQYSDGIDDFTHADEYDGFERSEHFGRNKIECNGHSGLERSFQQNSSQQEVLDDETEGKDSRPKGSKSFGRGRGRGRGVRPTSTENSDYEYEERNHRQDRSWPTNSKYGKNQRRYGNKNRDQGYDCENTEYTSNDFYGSRDSFSHKHENASSSGSDYRKSGKHSKRYGTSEHSERSSLREDEENPPRYNRSNRPHSDRSHYRSKAQGTSAFEEGR